MALVSESLSVLNDKEWEKKSATKNTFIEKDINAEYWRSVFSLAPDIFVNVWTPFAFAFLAFCQNFEGFKWNIITGSWMRCFFFIIFWHLFGIIGYSANWGVFVGLWGIMWLGFLYLLMALLKLWKGEENEQPVLQLDISNYLFVWFGVGRVPLMHGEKTRGGSFAATEPLNPAKTADSYQNYQENDYQQIDKQT
ncbi:hypothetical protein RFI_18973 [Reticulomyxa filosa]|uniref:Uncharacterized protein n=1 Tax=Reticulomyxa filosa TaxID=46433 RepID=X6MXU0_RETFI|nr:hypothetical protein RFI_18973 [Reticulomyxa filosa]|eukprot:ETO18307.1 hypothetical protein RFI_18973 [Reticulomyxa filosa]